jgi:hypothetical protein
VNCRATDSSHRPDTPRAAAQWLTDNERIRCTISVELGTLITNNPALDGLLTDTTKRNSQKLLTQRVQNALDRDAHAREALLALTQDPTSRAITAGTRASFLHQIPQWLDRKVALAWMQILILVPIATAFFTVWGGTDRISTDADQSTGVLRIFTVWVLSFLPCWLYVRFLGQRAGALWDEYVIHLHRLGVDEARYLPRPPKASEFHHEWLADNGYRYEDEHNIYRKKFNAYYGRAVSSAGSESDFAVKTETLFPVFLATTVLATCWTAVLWDLGFVQNPDTVWDILKFGFLGAYAFTVQSLIRRFFQSDLRPSAYASTLLRIIVVFTVLLPLYQLIDNIDLGIQAAIAFVVGAFPVVGIYALHRTAAVALRTAVPQLTPDYPLHQIDGLNVWYESRLVEEGIEDMQSLATANLVDVILHTRVPLGRLVDWIDQAHLYLHLDHAEVTGRERRQSLREANSGTSPRIPSAEPGTWSAQLSGSLGPSSRAGTQTRVQLRQLGIRTATDLLMAFPPDQIDPRSASPTAGNDYQKLHPTTGIDLDQIRILVRVLNQHTDLAPIWNWQRRGARSRGDHLPHPIRRNTIGQCRYAPAVNSPNGNNRTP